MQLSKSWDKVDRSVLFDRVCQICGKERYYGFEKEHAECYQIERERKAAKKTRKQWKRRRQRIAEIVFERNDYTCVMCGSKTDLTVDHIVPIVMGGTNHIDNLQTLCKSCNVKKADTVEQNDGNLF